jgi:protein required for attachment to host cells
MEAKSYWVVVADEYQACFYAREKRYSPLQELSSIRNEIARQKGGDVVTDRGGRAFDSQGQGRHSMAEKTGPKEQSYLAFAKEIAERVRDAKSRGQFDRLVVVAAPRFLGVLRPALATAGIEAERTVDKELTGKDAKFIQNLLDAD